MRIACVLIPRFPLALEVLGRAELRGLPLVLGGAPEERKVVVECSVAAEREGVRRGMPMREALARCRDAVFFEAHPSLYADTCERMLDALENISPIVEGAEPGCAYLDLTGLEGVGTELGERHLAAAMQRATKGAVGLTPRVGIADTRFAARAATFSGPVGIIAPTETAAFLAPLPVERLPLSDEMRRRLHWLGLRTIGQLAALPPGALAAQFGPDGGTAWGLARGEGGDPLLPRGHPPEVAAQFEFERPVVEIPPILAAARHLLARIVRRPACAGRAARGIALDAALDNGHRWRRQILFREPVADQGRMVRILAVRLDGVAFPAAVASLELRLVDLCGEAGTQGSLGTARARQVRGLDAALAHLHARFGRPLVMKFVELEPWSRFPERQYALIACEPSTSPAR